MFVSKGIKAQPLLCGFFKVTVLTSFLVLVIFYMSSANHNLITVKEPKRVDEFIRENQVFVTSLTSDFTSKTKKVSQLNKDKKLTQMERASSIYDFLKNITDVKDKNLLRLLTETLVKHHVSEDVDVETLKNKGWKFPYGIPPELQIKYSNHSWKGFPLPILTAMDLGRLGNKMGQYSTLMALGRLYNVTVFLHPHMKREITKFFPQLSLRDLPSNSDKWIKVGNAPPVMYNYAPIELAAAGLLGPRLFEMKDYAFQVNLFNSIRDQLKKEFTFAPNYKKKATEFLLSVKKKIQLNRTTDNITFVNFHIRRTDYKNHVKNFEGGLPTSTYFQTALEYYRSKLADPVFIAASDDRNFLNISLGKEKDVYFVPNVDGPTTMAILSSCNHSIMTLGSYGFWSGYLTGGEVVYPILKFGKPYRFTKHFYEEARLNFFTGIETETEFS